MQCHPRETWLCRSTGSSTQPFSRRRYTGPERGEPEQVRAGSVLASAGAEIVTVEGKAILCQVFFPADTWGEEHRL